MDTIIRIICSCQDCRPVYSVLKTEEEFLSAACPDGAHGPISFLACCRKNWAFKLDARGGPACLGCCFCSPSIWNLAWRVSWALENTRRGVGLKSESGHVCMQLYHSTPLPTRPRPQENVTARLPQPTGGLDDRGKARVACRLLIPDVRVWPAPTGLHDATIHEDEAKKDVKRSTTLLLPACFSNMGL